jgi:hypothetical protein
MATTHSDLRPIILRGKISGPKLRQGTLFVQQQHVILIAEEIGRWPSQQDHIATIALNLKSGNTFTLLIPFSYIDNTTIHDPTVISPLYQPLFLFEAIDYYRRITKLPLPCPPAKSPV